MDALGGLGGRWYMLDFVPSHRLVTDLASSFDGVSFVG